MMTHESIQVLVVDDEPSIRESLVEFLEDYDFQVSQADCAEDALVLLATHPHNVAIVDLRLPGMNGDALIQRAHKLQPKLRYLIHTGSVDYSVSEELERVGMRPEHIYHKPLMDLNLLIQGIENLMTEEKTPEK